MQRHIELIGAAWGLGGADPGCAQAPEALIPLLSGELARGGAEVSLGPMLHPSPKERRREAAVSKLCGALASAVASGACASHASKRARCSSRVPIPETSASSGHACSLFQ